MFHSYNTCTKDHLWDLFVSFSGQRSIKYKGSILWNGLPDDIKSIRLITSFVEKLKENPFVIY